MDECISCIRGFHSECMEHTCCYQEEKETSFVETKKVGRPQKPDDEVIDARSTGRKRANSVAPVDTNAPCEWQMQKNCGGGKYPIVGCINGTQKVVHHGDKDKLHNTPDNLHRICHSCHNRWHAANNPDFEASPHEPEPATAEEIAIAHLGKKR